METDLALEIEDLGLNVLYFGLITELLLDVGLEVVNEENVLVSKVELCVLVELALEGEILVDLVTCLAKFIPESSEVCLDCNHHISDVRRGITHEVGVQSACLLLV